MSSPNIQAPYVAPHQTTNPQDTRNAGIHALDDATQGWAAHAGASDVYISPKSLRSYFLHKITGSADTVWIPPNIERRCVVLNLTSADIKIRGVYQSHYEALTIAPGFAQIIYLDGTTSGVTRAGAAVATGAGTGATKQPTTGALSLQGFAPSVLVASHVPSPAVGSVSFTGLAPSVTITSAMIVSPQVGTLTLTGTTPQVNPTPPITISVPAGSLSLTGLQPNPNEPPAEFVRLLMLFEGNDGDTTAASSAALPVTVTLSDMEIDTGVQFAGNNSATVTTSQAGTGVIIDRMPELEPYQMDYQLDMWLRITDIDTAKPQQRIFTHRNGLDILMDDDNTGDIRVFQNGGQALDSGASGELTVDTDHHLTVARHGSHLRMWIDGQFIVKNINAGGEVTDDTSYDLIIGNLEGFDQSPVGNIGVVRWCPGFTNLSSDRNFTPPTVYAIPPAVPPTEHPPYSKVQLLTLFEGSDGATTTTDSSQNTFSVTLTNAEIDTGIPVHGDSSLLISAQAGGNGAYVDQSTDLDLGQVFQVEAWIRPSSIAGTQYIIGKWDDTGNQRAWVLWMSGGELAFSWSTDGSNSPGVSSGKLSAGVDYHVEAGRDDTNRLRLWINGYMVHESTQTNVFHTPSERTYVGGTDTNASSFLGNIGAARVTVDYNAHVQDTPFIPPSSYPTSASDTLINVPSGSLQLLGGRPIPDPIKASMVTGSGIVQIDDENIRAVGGRGLKKV